MCGIIGCAGSVGFGDEKAFKQLLVVDSLRGDDSTGVASATHKGEVMVAKSVGDPFQLMDSRHFQEIMKRKNAVLIGHNRAATTGKVTRKNAHPFEFDTLVGVHNGTLKNKGILSASHKYDTDSEALYHDIEDKGLEETIRKVQGAYALVWYNKEEHTLNMLRNEERPLHFAFTKDKKRIYFASEPWMILAILHREKIFHEDIQTLPVDQHYSFQIPEADKEFEKAKVRAVSQAPFQTAYSVQTGGTQTTSHGTIKTGYPKAEDFFRSYREKQAKATSAEHWNLKIGQELNCRAVWWSMREGGVYVAFDVPKYSGCEFRCYVKDANEARNIVEYRGSYKAKISRMESEKGKWIYKFHIDSLKQVPLLPVIVLEKDEPEEGEVEKLDHAGVFLNKEQFEHRYSTCQWCTSPVTFEEGWHAIGATEILCESCVSDPEVKQYIPDLRNHII